MKAREPKPDIATALTVAAFCEMFCITPELYAALKRTGRGPREVRVGRCPLWLAFRTQVGHRNMSKKCQQQT